MILGLNGKLLPIPGLDWTPSARQVRRNSWHDNAKGKERIRKEKGLSVLR